MMHWSYQFCRVLNGYSFVLDTEHKPERFKVERFFEDLDAAFGYRALQACVANRAGHEKNSRSAFSVKLIDTIFQFDACSAAHVVVSENGIYQ